MPLASLTVENLAAILTILTVAGAALVGILKLGREGRGAVVSEQSTLLQDMRGLNDELAETAARIRGERDNLAGEVSGLRRERDELREMTERLQRALTAIIDELEETAAELEDQAKGVRKMVDSVKVQIERLRQGRAVE